MKGRINYYVFELVIQPLIATLLLLFLLFVYTHVVIFHNKICEKQKRTFQHNVSNKATDKS